MAKQAKKLADSKAVLTANRDKRTRAVLIVEGISQPPDQRMLHPNEMNGIRIANDGPIAEAYQRLATSEVNDLIHVLRAGGLIYDPVTIAVRRDGTKWMVDGQQRFLAAYECGVSIPATFYKSDGPRAEALLFQAMNNRRALTPDMIVKSHQGPSADLIRAAFEDHEHGLGGHVHFGDKTRRPYAASHLMRGVFGAATGKPGGGKIQDVAARADHAMRNAPGAEDRCRAFLKLVSLVFPPKHPSKILPMHALAIVAHRRWSKTMEFPAPRIYSSLSRIPWDSYFSSPAQRFLPSVIAAIENRWK